MVSTVSPDVAFETPFIPWASQGCRTGRTSCWLKKAYNSSVREARPFIRGIIRRCIWIVRGARRQHDVWPPLTRTTMATRLFLLTTNRPSRFHADCCLDFSGGSVKTTKKWGNFLSLMDWVFVPGEGADSGWDDAAIRMLVAYIFGSGKLFYHLHFLFMTYVTQRKSVLWDWNGEIQGETHHTSHHSRFRA